MAHRDRREANPRRSANATKRERRPARIRVVRAGGLQCDLVAQRDDVLQQAMHLARCGAAVQGRDDFEGQLHTFEVGREPRLQVCIQNVKLLRFQ